MLHNRLRLTPPEEALLAGANGGAARLAMRIVARMGEILGARELVEIDAVGAPGPGEEGTVEGTGLGEGGEEELDTRLDGGMRAQGRGVHG